MPTQRRAPTKYQPRLRSHRREESGFGTPGAGSIEHRPGPAIDKLSLAAPPNRRRVLERGAGVLSVVGFDRSEGEIAARPITIA